MQSPEVELQDKEPQIEMNQEWPGYARPWLLQELGVESKHVEGSEAFFINGQQYRIGSLEETYLHRKPELIKSIVDLIRKVDELPSSGTWLYRGHHDSTLPLRCSLDRASCRKTRGSLDRSEHEKRLFEEFKRRAIPYLKSVPQNDWEWLAMLATTMGCRPACSTGHRIR